MTVYRICSSQYPKNDGEGSKRHGGRWNHKGTPMLYCGANVSLCVLEVLVHSGNIPKEKILIEADLPDDLPITALAEASLPPGWDASADQDSTRDIGTRWAKRKRTAVMSVPSAIVKKERNYLINPLHPDFFRIRFSDPELFLFDPRLK